MISPFSYSVNSFFLFLHFFFRFLNTVPNTALFLNFQLIIDLAFPKNYYRKNSRLPSKQPAQQKGSLMRKFSLSEISLLHIQIFLVACQELNFTKTASRCFVTQPTVSRAIDALEKSSGLQLFIREHSSLRLTPAGKALYKSLEQAVDLINTGFLHALELQEGYHSALKISYPAYTNLEILMQIVHSMKSEDPCMKIHYSSYQEFHQELPRLFSYETDFIIAHMHDGNSVQNYPELNCCELIQLPLTVFMKKENPLSVKTFLTLQDLKNQRIIFPKEHTNLKYRESILGSFKKAGIEPLISYEVETADEGILNLQAENEVVILSHLFSGFRRQDCVEIPLSGSHSGLLLISRSADQNNRQIQAFVHAAKKYRGSLHL